MAPRPGLAVRAEMPQRDDPLRRLVETDHIAVRPDGPGRVFVVLPIDAEVELGGMQPGPVPIDDPLVTQMMDWGTAVVPALAMARPVSALVGVRPIPTAGLPCVGEVLGIPGYIEAVTNSGDTLAPLIARLLTEEILGEPGNPLLAPFRPDRFPIA
jgi:glycine/D-amino acid oxidase-like deaminating enzyme